MRKKPWRKRFYIDLQAGPGKNHVEHTGEILLGSPLLALTCGAGFTDYRFVEKNQACAETLLKRSEVSGRIKPEDIIVGDCNEVVHGIVDEINKVDAAFREGSWSSLSLAFLDPEGLELEYETVAKLATMNRIDLIINFSSGGVRRAAINALDLPAGNTQMDRFFGSTEWRKTPLVPGGRLPVNKWLALYKSRLEGIGFKWGEVHSVRIKTTHGVELYRLLFASKSEVGIDFWEKARKRGPEQLSLL
jgi:three-Cys-motif partner protein